MARGGAACAPLFRLFPLIAPFSPAPFSRCSRLLLALTEGAFALRIFSPLSFGHFVFAVLGLPLVDPTFAPSSITGSVSSPETGLGWIGSVDAAGVGWVGLGRTGSGSSRTCVDSSLSSATPGSRSPTPDGCVVTTPSGGPSSFQASAASSSSSLTSPAMIASAIRPAFWRTAASILLATSGFSLRNCLAFSRPCPMRWLS